MENKKYCQECNNVLHKKNKVGLCYKCYPVSEYFLEDMKNYQKEKYHNDPEYRKKKLDYQQLPSIKARRKVYMKQYIKKNIEKIRESKRNWATKYRQLHKK